MREPIRHRPPAAGDRFVADGCLPLIVDLLPSTATGPRPTADLRPTAGSRPIPDSSASPCLRAAPGLSAPPCLRAVPDLRPAPNQRAVLESRAVSDPPAVSDSRTTPGPRAIPGFRTASDFRAASDFRTASGLRVDTVSSVPSGVSLPRPLRVLTLTGGTVSSESPPVRGGGTRRKWDLPPPVARGPNLLPEFARTPAFTRVLSPRRSLLCVASAISVSWLASSLVVSVFVGVRMDDLLPCGLRKRPNKDQQIEHGVDRTPVRCCTPHWRLFRGRLEQLFEDDLQQRYGRCVRHQDHGPGGSPVRRATRRGGGRA